jgi:AcrR family transcriptional regulator
VPRQVDRSTRLDALCDAVHDLVVEEGFGAVTVRRVAARVGASTSAVTHYVTDRDELVRAAVQRETARRRALLDGRVAPLDGAAGVRSLVEWAVLGPARASHRFWLALVVGAQSDPVLREELDAFNRWWCERLDRFVADLDPAPVAPDAVVDAVTVIVDGMVLAGFDDGTPWAHDRRRRAVDLLLAPLGL